MLGPKQQRWVDELRSGNWKQYTGGLLYYDGAYCCLGVADKLFNLGNIERCNNSGINDTEPECLLINYKELGLYYPAGTVRKFGFIPNTKAQTLTQLNDSGYTFAEIADIIEQNPELFFTHAV